MLCVKHDASGSFSEEVIVSLNYSITSESEINRFEGNIRATIIIIVAADWRHRSGAAPKRRPLLQLQLPATLLLRNGDFSRAALVVLLVCYYGH